MTSFLSVAAARRSGAGRVYYALLAVVSLRSAGRFPGRTMKRVPFLAVSNMTHMASWWHNAVEAQISH